MTPTIKIKFLVGFFVIFALSLLLLNAVVVRVIDASNEKIITQDLTGLKKNSNVYIKQAFMINQFQIDEIYFGQISKEIVEELRRVTSSELSAYTVEGELIYASDEPAFTRSESDDLKHALQGHTTYTISYTNGRAEVYYAYPVIIDGIKVGILRFAKDFSLLYEQSRIILNVIFYVTISIFAAAYLFSYLLSRNITIPLVKLERASTEVANGNLNIRIGIKRKDEIGRLADNFNRMIHKIKQQIRRIEQDRDRLEELNRHRKQFFDNVTHELKTPLTSILGYAQMIQDNGSTDTAFLNKGMNHILRESKRLHEMVIKLLELSKEASGQEVHERIDVGPILRDVCEGMTFKAERYHKRIVCNADSNLLVWGSAHKVRQLFINVIDNAIKYSDDRSKIYAEAKLFSDSVQIRIVNQGKTISPEDLVNLFEPFFRARSRKSAEAGSVGLGLYICKEIVEDHRGHIDIQSCDGETSVFMELPHLSKGRDDV
ncbi:two-component sensor histidine kinase [Cohnella sp. CIP 111063]|uniref:sensor histidine kinase n=1 Tax=unclassified Cohnella TaxID=2636738 RepID=UPI000B8BCF37|nr:MULTISPECIES: HAMP domain-containing sensor histidine kinase [unclassified Cohnella]OXS54766.1 two-component sensor histidine kinase [Cohnella sp. CIP 111063]PRX64604.1 signal transduction histidine kinase [Cohnella sp. SGD-V74]